MCQKIRYNRNVRNRVNKTEFERIVLNFIFYFDSITKIKIVYITFFWVFVPFIFDKLCCILNFRLFLLQILEVLYISGPPEKFFQIQVRSSKIMFGDF